MKFMIIGAGSMGYPIGWSLMNAGYEVCFYVRPGSASNRPKKINILNIDQRPKKFRQYSEIFEPRYIESLSEKDTFDIILAPVKHYQWKDLFPMLSNHCKNATIVTLGNLWEGFEQFDQIFGDRLIHGFFHFTSVLKGSECKGFISPNVSLGTAKNAARLSVLKDSLCKSGFTPKIRPNMREWLICHFAFNAAFISAAAVAEGLGNLINSSKHIRLMDELGREAFKVVKARRIDPNAFPDQSGLFKMPWYILKFIIKLLSFTTPMKVSIENSHIDGKEIKSYYFDMMETALNLGIDIPNFKSIEPFMKRIEDNFRP